jgi:MbtH protein
MAVDPQSGTDGVLYEVVVNEEDQYSTWRADREPPSGWRLAGMSGTSSECLAYIAQIWTDMRPRSVRNA